MNKKKQNQESVESINLCKSLPTGQVGVIQTSDDIVKAHGGELKVQVCLRIVGTGRFRVYY